MKRTLKLARPAVALLLLTTFTPAHAQFAGADELQQMEQLAPVLETMKKHMGKKRFGQLMQTVGPMMEQMMPPGGAVSPGGFGDGAGLDFHQVAPFINGQTIAGLLRTFEPAERPRAARGAKRRMQD